MISFFTEEVDVDINEDKLESWIENVVFSEGKKIGEISFIFCTDEYLLKINQEFLHHDTYTDIISFDNTLGNELSGDIFISINRVKENAEIFQVIFPEELRRVIIHGILHFCGFKDKSEKDKALMRKKENEKLALFHVEQC